MNFLGFSDFAIILSTLLGPVLAVQAQKWLERRQDKDQRRLWIFRTLMSTRAERLSPSHVESLNAIPIEFYGKNKKFIDVINAWKLYLDHLSDDKAEPNGWAVRRVDLFSDLLLKISKSLDYSFTKLEIEKEVYSPQGHVNIDAENTVIRRGLFEIMTGERSLPLEIRSIYQNPDFVAKQAEIQGKLNEWLDGARTVKVDSLPARNDE